MSYSSENILASGTRIQDVREFVLLLGFKKAGLLKDQELGRFEEYLWFEADDYKSWTTVELSIHRNDNGLIAVGTRTSVSRSYFDLTHQNRTISGLRKRFGGEFVTDEGRGRYLKPGIGPPPAPASGCFLAFSRFGENLIKAMLCHRERTFPNHPDHPAKDWRGVEFLQEFDPRTIANNTLVPFLVASSEDYFKSSFTALLRYSPRKEAFLKSVRLQGEQLLAIADNRATVEEQVSETLSFQRLSAVCRHFDLLDAKLDIAGILRKPYRRRSQSLFESLELLVSSRHDLIHRAIIDRTMTDQRIYDVMYDLEAAITRVYRRITDHYDWFYDKSWSFGRRPSKKVQRGEPA